MSLAEALATKIAKAGTLGGAGVSGVDGLTHDNLMANIITKYSPYIPYF